MFVDRHPRRFAHGEEEEVLSIIIAIDKRTYTTKCSNCDHTLDLSLSFLNLINNAVKKSVKTHMIRQSVLPFVRRLAS